MTTDRPAKQLDQLKVENEILVKDKANLDAINKTLKAQFNQLQTENDSLKSELMRKNCYLEADKETIDQLKAENKKLKEDLDKLYNFNRKIIDKQLELDCQNTKHKQALQEIIKITEEQQSWNECNMRYSETESEDDIFAYNWSALNQILQKCEVLKDE